RVERDGVTHEPGLQDVALELLHEQDDGEHDDRRLEVLVDEGDEDGDRPADEGPDDRDERAEEDERGEREHERQPEDPGTEPDADGVDEGDEDLGPGVPTEGHPAADARLVDAVAGPSWGEPDEPLPDVPAVLEEEEETEERDDGP